ncbi:sugar ABC transporter permease [Amycolatopsis acidiphila]|uniref:Sugar ABC transporter permease n=1 Tax=Amycolatopsis acidiphila TaxID=715473 RepID=A0A558AJ33_9PSEU|nr:sugar ABC transporter permease [Amycolatopsis acidiphila]TVT24259.1 sugar ABC transporter permease [Amycolatopsis acidiphila]UIJ62610.1 sugar ABC transporter permease [Amycolatopsis acidiphila]GHG85753.1 ABC transporter permease [Amycolatopsis acidiphila]
MSTVTEPTAPARPPKARGAASARIPFSSRLSPTRFGLMLVAPVLVLLLAIVVYPVAYSLYLSFVRTNPITGRQTFVGLKNFQNVFTDPAFWHSTWLTLYYVVCVTVLAAGISLGMALLLREKFIGRPVLMAVIVLPWSLSTYAAGVVWRYVFSPQYGLLAGIFEKIGLSPVDFLSQNSVIPSLAVVHAWQFAPLGAYFLLASLQVIPEDLYKLGKVDGMGILRRFTAITLPYIRLPLSIFLVLVGGQAATAFDLIYFLTSGGPGSASQTLTYDIYQQTFQDQSFGAGAATSWVLLVVLTVVTAGYYAVAMSSSRREKKVS